MNIFIVEDDIDLQNIYEFLLITNGFQVIGKADNGEEAITKYRNFIEKPDIILMDHRMPIKNGIKATKEIIMMNKNAKILFASADLKVKKQALLAGAKYFLTKPFSCKQLIQKINLFFIKF
ncbi:MAG: response regulator [Candidatus Lokiarchaeota archaeon]|nr:response regulator [Candidatus Lokiarchaeota archaeon]